MLRELSKDFQRTLIAKSHNLKPVVMIGTNGLTENVHHEIDAALLKHKLIKVRITSTTRLDRAKMVSDIAKTHEAFVIHQIGHTVVLYRPKPEK